MALLSPSRYNFAFRGGDGAIAIFNASTGCVDRLDGPDARSLAALLLDIDAVFAMNDFSPELGAKLRRGGFLIARGDDEIQTIRERYWRARGQTPVVLTITTTMDCNLGCYYCYEERSGSKLTSADVGAIVDLAKKRVEESGQRALHVDWYGGEPLLNLAFLDEASKALQAYCAGAGVNYVASIISNGSQWPADVENFVSRNRIRQVQISFDGLKANHDKRRRYRKGYGQAGASSFSQAVALVDALVACTRVDVRFNLDRGNAGDILPFIAFAKARGWFDALFPAVFQPARLASYSAASGFMRDHQLSLAEFDGIRAAVRLAVGSSAKIEESEVPDGFPYPRTSVCAALASNSVVVGAEGLTYRCGLQVGEANRAVGALNTRDASKQDLRDAGWWDDFDPTRSSSCSRCSFLPICWGGCPKKHLEGDQQALNEQGRYWRTNLPRLIAKAAGIDNLEEAVIPDALQFRTVSNASGTAPLTQSV
jgi:uncharacterized protein